MDRTELRGMERKGGIVRVFSSLVFFPSNFLLDFFVQVDYYKPWPF